MSFNLVDMVKDQVTSQVISYVGNMIGGDLTQSKSLVDGIIPSILNGLVDTSSTSIGADTLLKAVDETDETILDSIGDMLNGGYSNSLIEVGTNMLSSVLGNNHSAILNSISKATNTDKGHTSSVMGLLAPIIFSVIKRKLMGDGGFNVDGLMNLFSSQKENITAALPQILKSNSTTHVKNEKEEDETHIETEKEGRSILIKLLPLLVLGAAAGWFGYKHFMNKSATTKETTTVESTKDKKVETQVVDVNKKVDVVELGTNVDGTMNVILTRIKEIKDVASAKEAISLLNQSADNLEIYASLLENVNTGAKVHIVEYVTKKVPEIQDVLTKVTAIPGVGEVLEPAVENLNSKLSLFK